ncbi:hypothetical protein [Rhizobium binxianense]|uniref:hypothetical protein n=1 Tax=Rhizobium binxianense TaxID=3024242 RepID=UPI00235E0FF9|nr:MULTISPECIES: hypothetical protein [unclassified Rhizobium]MDC9808494.1 hypothetical protein [Rhizobium sp. MC62]WEA60476.1 hypothetical protein PO860_00925 [Rhizobium sp. BJ04]
MRRIVVLTAATGLLLCAFEAKGIAQNATDAPPFSTRELTDMLTDAVGRIQLMEAEVEANRVPVGSYILMERKCPGRQFQDVTDQFDGRLLKVSKNVAGSPITNEGDGSHEHVGGQHTHNVEGITTPLGGGQRKGTLDRDTTVPHEGTRPRVTGTALPSEHSHQGGAHEHAAVAFRICKVIY